MGGIPYSTTKDQLQELFSKAGAVESVDIIIDRNSGQSKGFGFVEMNSEDEAKKAIEMFDKYKMDDRTMVVNEARPKTDRGDRPNFGGGYQRR